ncbi:MAG: hypothetical protein LC659_14780, partial [Myxococcales bacterium]|nr:hypothetical protein [Myxococcales bacterium]
AERLDLRGYLPVAERLELGVEARLIFLAERRAGGEAEELDEALAILVDVALQIDRGEPLRRRVGGLSAHDRCGTDEDGDGADAEQADATISQ